MEIIKETDIEEQIQKIKKLSGDLEALIIKNADEKTVIQLNNRTIPIIFLILSLQVSSVIHSYSLQ